MTEMAKDMKVYRLGVCTLLQDYNNVLQDTSIKIPTDILTLLNFLVTVREHTTEIPTFHLTQQNYFTRGMS